MDILEPSRLEIFNEIEENNFLKIPRGISLFKPVPDYRTCQMAGIPENFCMCNNIINATFNDSALNNSIHQFIFEINKILSPYPQCAKLEYSKLIGAKKWTWKNETYEIDALWTDYIITVETDRKSVV